MQRSGPEEENGGWGYEDSLEVRNLREDRGFRANRVPKFVIFGQTKFSFLSKTKLNWEMGRRILNDALRTIVNAERRGFASANLQPISGVMASFLQIMKYRG